MDCTGCIHKKICELWGNAEGQDASCYDDSCKETLSDILGDDYDLDRLKELAEADREGRCVVLWCLTGETLYTKSVISGEISEFNAPDIHWIIDNQDNYGKTIFRDADAALSAMKGDQP